MMRYKFRYFNGFIKTAVTFITPIQNFWMLEIFCYALFFLVGKLAVVIGAEEYLFNDTVLSVLRTIVSICAISWAVMYCVFRKGVLLYEDCLVIARYTITPTNWKNRITIDYNDIAKVNVNYVDLNYIDYRFRMVVLGGDRAYNVELALKNGKRYYFSIENQEEFCDNLNSIIENRNHRPNKEV
ncbi:MAG: hypothetical protein NC397_08210 [Clostridium sp.]|nr:hypothetical protein [Clostridium sp.]